MKEGKKSEEEKSKVIKSDGKLHERLVGLKRIIKKGEKGYGKEGLDLFPSITKEKKWYEKEPYERKWDQFGKSYMKFDIDKKVELNTSNIYDKNQYVGNVYEKILEDQKSSITGKFLFSIPEVDSSVNASTKLEKGINYVDQNKFEEAEVMYKEALIIYERLAKINPEIHLPNVADVQERLGKLYVKLNRLEEAEILYKGALKIYGEIVAQHPNDFSPKVSTILNELGLIYYGQEKYSEALESYESALKIYEHSGDTNGKAASLNNIGDVYKEQGRNEEAFRVWNESVQSLEQLGIIDKKLEKKIEDIEKEVYFSIYAPTSIHPGEKFNLYIWAYLYEQKFEMEIGASKNESYEKREDKGPFPARKGDIIQVLLALPPPFEVLNELDNIIWREKITKAAFPVSLPENVDTGIHFGHVKIYMKGIPIIRIDFTLKIGKSDPQLIKISQEVKRAVRAFASYSRTDEIEVVQTIQGIRTLGIKVFLDNLSIKQGEYWEPVIFKNILRSDLLLLFWSRAAIDSVWVDKEWRFAYEKYGEEFIQPIPLEHPDIAPPPNELDSKHFYDETRVYLDHLKYKAEELKQITDTKLTSLKKQGF